MYLHSIWFCSICGQSLLSNIIVLIILRESTSLSTNHGVRSVYFKSIFVYFVRDWDKKINFLRSWSDESPVWYKKKTRHFRWKRHNAPSRRHEGHIAYIYLRFLRIGHAVWILLSTVLSKHFEPDRFLCVRVRQ